MTVALESIVASSAILQPYLGQVANGCRVSTGFGGPTAQMMSRSPHVAKDAIAALAIVLPSWIVSATYVETVTAAPITFTASIEYPAGATPIQITFGGAASATPVSGASIRSDMITIPGGIPSGARFWVRTFQQGVAGGAGYGVVFGDQLDAFNGGSCAFAASGVIDQTMTSATVINQAGNSSACFTPIAIVAMTSKVSWLLASDSRTDGFSDTFDASGDLGELGRPIGGAGFGYINAGVRGDNAQAFITQFSGRLRVQLAQYVSHVAVGYGINDVEGAPNSPYSTLRVNLDTVYRYWPSKKVYGATIAPRVGGGNGGGSSSDNFATVTGQTPSTLNVVRAAINDYIRTTPLGLVGYFDVADAVESSRNSGRWKANGTANYYVAADGTHETQAGYLLPAQSPQISAALAAVAR